MEGSKEVSKEGSGESLDDRIARAKRERIEQGAKEEDFLLLEEFGNEFGYYGDYACDVPTRRPKFESLEDYSEWLLYQSFVAIGFVMSYRGHKYLVRFKGQMTNSAPSDPSRACRAVLLLERVSPVPAPSAS